MLTIWPYHKEGNLCIDDNIESVAKFFNKEYIYMYTKGLNFTYNHKIQEGICTLSKIIVNCTYPSKEKDFPTAMRYMQDIVGLRLEFIPCLGFTIDDYVCVIREYVMEGVPVGIFFDTFDTPWHTKFYHKTHMPHVFLVVDVFEEERYLLCVDGVISNTPVKLPFQEIVLNKGILSYEPITPRFVANLRNIIMTVTDGLTDGERSNKYDYMRLFSHDIRKLTFTDEERASYKDLNIAPFMFGMKSIEYARKNIADMFLYMSGKFNEKSKRLLDIHSMMVSAAKQWELFIVYMIKGFYSTRKTDCYMDEAANILLALANSEEDIAYVLLDL